MRDFSRATIKTLAKRGVRVIGTQAIPAYEGDRYFSGVAYVLDVSGTSAVRTHAQVLDMAK